jgi:uncharacterized glyoxalase superfamily protein PhnB
VESSATGARRPQRSVARADLGPCAFLQDRANARIYGSAHDLHRPKGAEVNEPPAQNIFPAIRYRDAEAALAWLQRAFGFECKEVHRSEDGTVGHAELALGTGLVMFGQWHDGGWLGGDPPHPRASTTSLYVVVPDPDVHYQRARGAGAEIVRELVDQPYGSREYSARDPEGNLWSFGTYDPGRVG